MDERKKALQVDPSRCYIHVVVRLECKVGPHASAFSFHQLLIDFGSSGAGRLHKAGGPA